METNSERPDLVMQLKRNHRYTILVSGASGIVGYGILKSLKDLDCLLIGTTIYEESPANCFADIVEISLLTSDEKYIPWLINIIKKYSVDMIIPAIEADMSMWNKNRVLLEETGTFVLLNTSSLIELCLDKWSFYEKLESHKNEYRIKSSIEPNFELYSLPFLLKPRCGFGSKGIVLVESLNTFELHKDKIGRDLMMQEFVGTDDEEYTISAFFDIQSNLKALMALKRKLSKLGFTEIAEVVPYDDIKSAILELAHILKPVGPTNFQFRKHYGKWKLLEVNPRISSSTSIRKAFGYNESKMCIEYFMQGKEISQPEIKMGKAIRYSDDFIFYDSDNI